MNTSVPRALLMALAVTASCRGENRHGDQAAALQARNPRACTLSTYRLQLPSTGAFVLNSEPRDSLGLSRWLAEVLPKREGERRIVMVQLDERRRAALDWLVPAIHRAGGEAYEFDPTCRMEIPSRSPS